MLFIFQCDDNNDENTMSAPPSPREGDTDRESLWQALHQRNGDLFLIISI